MSMKPEVASAINDGLEMELAKWKAMYEKYKNSDPESAAKFKKFMQHAIDGLEWLENYSNDRERLKNDFPQ